MTKSLLFAVTLLATGLPTVAAVPDVQPGLEALRSGRFEDARVLFDRIAAQEAAAPEGPFFQAFDLWWRLLDEPADADALRRRMEDFLEEATRRADRMRSARDEATRERGLVFSGVSMLLSAQSLAGRGRHFRAGTMARRGHRRLVRALKIRPGSPDAFFALGAYDYYADKLPAIVKGLRFLLMIPGGDDKRGISRLETAAEKSRLFGTESLMLLSHIYASKFEKNYRRALAYSRRALERHPSSPLIGLAHASLLFKVGRFRSAAETARAALEVISRSSGYSGEMARYAQFRLAACALQTGDPLAAMDRIESTLQASIPTAPSE
ncbi:MAG: hypothetical protein ACE5HU_02670, partial [Acidobacteriota bacterium]